MATKVCKECKKERRLTEFKYSAKYDLEGLPIRKDTCRHCNYDGLTGDQKHLIIREAYRNYLTFKAFVSATGKDVLEYTVPVADRSDEYETIAVSFTDLERALKWYSEGLKRDGTILSKRKEQAFYLNVIRDMLQRDVAEIMNITTVSVGQYVEQGMLQLVEYYFAEDKDKQSMTVDSSYVNHAFKKMEKTLDSDTHQEGE